MDKKARRAYDKAMNYCEKGKINKALNICEDILLEGLNNSSVLNFKGLLLYQKGELNEAITIWNMNRDLNNDNVARNYIKDAVADEKRLELYKRGEQELKQLKVDKALELFMRCVESDFNAIKVNTGIAMCYQKKGDFYKAKEYVDKALRIDKGAITARNLQKELEESGIYIDGENSSKGVLLGITILITVVAIVIGGYTVISKYKNVDSNNIAEEVKKNEGDVNEEVKESEVKGSTQSDLEVSQEAKNNTQKNGFNKDKAKLLIDNNDFVGLFEQLKDVKQESISNEDFEVYEKSIDLMKNQGVSQFYENGLRSFNENNYSEAKISLDKAYIYCEGNSLKEHILFYRASSASKLPDSSDAIGEYEEYYKLYPKGVYTQEALYDLTLLTNLVDKQKSINYAKILINNYPDSIYANDTIKGIANE